MADFRLEVQEIEKLQKAMQEYQGDTESAINEVLHNEAGDMAQEGIFRLMPRSAKTKGKHARDSKSLRNVNGNLSVTVTTQKKFQYLYFPDDGTNTRRHVGNQQFFMRGGESVQDEIVDRCIQRLVNDFENSM